MKRRGIAAGWSGKGHVGLTPKNRKMLTAHSPEEFHRLKRELDEALEQQAATSEVLRVISSSPGELDPVFNAMLENATRICEAKFGILFRYEGSLFHPIASLDVPPAFGDFLKRQGSFAGKPGRLFGRLCQSKRVIHVVDRATEPEPSPSVRYAGARSCIAVPMLKENELVGAFFIYRNEVRPFTDKQIELVQNFAAQAVIAIENTRLLNELRQRTDDLTELLEQQTATSEILEVISNSPTDMQPAFDAIVRSGLKLFPDAVLTISLPDRDLVKLAAIGGPDEAGLQALRGRYPMPLSHEFITGTAILDQREIDLADAHEPPKELRVGARNLLAGGYRAMTVMPMMRGNETIGALNVIRRNPGLLSDKQRELLRTFANQAVIAIENTRLFNELRESLQQQTATADVLKVISSSPGDMKPVFEAMLTNALRICEAKFGHLLLYDGERFHAAHLHDVPAAYREYWQKHGPIRPDPNTGLGRIVRDKQMFHIPDLKAEAAYAARDFCASLPSSKQERARLSECRCSRRTNSLAPSSSTARRCVPSPRDRSNCLRTSPHRPSSPSKTRDCSTSCANCFSNRPPPPTCSRSSAARHSICRWCSPHWSNWQRGSARPIMHGCSSARAIFLAGSPATAMRPTRMHASGTIS